jgi:alkanesulfonate monooxygenase SsuD/methylene tetrahydromethanopterin reductase-like flavin-dependent oxidoreductase (luciferase family)
MCLGDPHQVVEAIKRWESIGVDQMNFLLNAVEVLPQEQVIESMRLFAREVMPAF